MEEPYTARTACWSPACSHTAVGCIPFFQPAFFSSQPMRLCWSLYHNEHATSGQPYRSANLDCKYVEESLQFLSADRAKKLSSRGVAFLRGLSDIPLYRTWHLLWRWYHGSLQIMLQPAFGQHQLDVGTFWYLSRSVKGGMLLQCVCFLVSLIGCL